jgi:dipeptidyl-peptidase 4
MQKRLAIFLFFAPLFLFAQQSVTLEDCFENFKYYPESSPNLQFMADGRTFLVRNGGLLVRRDIASGDSLEVFFDKKNLPDGGATADFSSFELSKDESKMLLAMDAKSIYRHSFEANFFIFDRAKYTLEPLDENGLQQVATFSPDGSKIAWMRANNLFIKELDSKKTTQVTTDGEKNSIINGVADWVYEEEFSSVSGAGMSAISWSPDSRRLAWLRFDESKVPQMHLDYFEESMYPRGSDYKYPKVGEPNSAMSARIFDTKTTAIAVVQTGDADQYLPRINWSRDPKILTISRLNRHQDNLDLLACNAELGNISTILAEKSATYVEIHDNLTWMPDGKTFLWTSESDGWNHLYLRDFDGKIVRQLTLGDFDLTAFYGFDEKTNTVFYQTAQPTPMDRQVWSLSLSNLEAKPVCLTPNLGTSEVNFSPSFEFFKLDWSDANTPTKSWICDVSGKKLRQLVDNQALNELRDRAGFSKKAFFTFKTPEGTELNGWMMKPKNFDANRKYPILMSVYGGPGSQEVLNSYDGYFGTYYQMLNQQGYVVACVDNRGTGARGKKFKDCTHLNLGKYEVADQIDAAKYLARQPWADAARIGIWGWSYGGYMSANCIFKGADVFKAAAAVAPVTNWKWYDSAYTERYLHTPTENPTGFEENSPINFADKLRGNFFLAHGLADDNVHWQNSAELSNALIKNNKQFEEHFYPNRNHGIYGDGASMHLFWELTEFFMTKL